MKEGMPRNAMLIAGRVSRRTGIPLDDIIKYYMERRSTIAQRDSGGKYRVWGIDLFDMNHWIAAEGSTSEKVVEIARRMTETAAEASKSDHNMTAVFCAYDPSGKYLG